MIQSTPAETRQQYRDRGNMLPSDYELEQRYGNATLGAVYWERGEDCFDELKRDVRGFIGAIRKSIDNTNNVR